MLIWILASLLACMTVLYTAPAVVAQTALEQQAGTVVEALKGTHWLDVRELPGGEAAPSAA